MKAAEQKEEEFVEIPKKPSNSQLKKKRKWEATYYFTLFLSLIIVNISCSFTFFKKYFAYKFPPSIQSQIQINSPLN